MQRGGKRKGAGRKPGSNPKSRLIQKQYRCNKMQLEALEKAAKAEGKALSMFVLDSAVEKAGIY